MKSTPLPIGANIKAARLAAGPTKKEITARRRVQRISARRPLRPCTGPLTQVEAAARAGMSQTAWSSIESDQKRPYADTLVAIAEALGVEVEELLRRC